MAIFHQGVAAVHVVTNGAHSVYVCPLCGEGFERESLDRGYLTLEHVPPKSSGGKGIVLTCRPCNNRGGATVDAAVAARKESLDFLKALVASTGDVTRRAKLTVGGLEQNVDLRVEGPVEDRKLYMFGSGNHPDTVTRIERFMNDHSGEGKGDGLQFSISPSAGFNERLAQVGDLRTAYLGAFAALGYRYAFNSRLDPIRQQIANPREVVFEGFHAYCGSPEQPGLLVCRDPQVLMVSHSGVFVFLPWLEGPEDPYPDLQRLKAEGARGAFYGKLIPWPNRFEPMLDL